jgi:hypothetical protein
MGIRIQGFDDRKLKKINLKKKFDPKLQSLPYAFIKDVQAAEEAFSLQKRTSRTSKHEIFQKKFCFCPLGSGSGYGSPDLNDSGSNPDPNHW